MAIPSTATRMHMGILFMLCLVFSFCESFSLSVPHLRLRTSGNAFSRYQDAESCPTANAGGCIERCRATPRASMSSLGDHDRMILNLLQLCASTNRGSSASLDQKYDIEAAIAELECASPIERPSVSEALNGEWNLLYSSEAMTRTSPFFWGFRKAVEGVDQPLPVLPTELSEALFAITDGLPFASIGTVMQTVLGAGTNGTKTLESSVQILLRIFDPLVPPQVGYITTTSSFEVESPTSLVLTVQHTAVKRSTWSQLPVIGGLVEGAKFPSRQVFEQVKQGSSEVIMEVSYLSDELRVTRNENGQVFVFGKVSAGVSDTGFN
mmetsp:Transcript_33559/g.80027  ORF Transcript_33559/g.80027 Transcript_33559/m.80027 type:complete len:323 (-) Transcript_33559:37-1005(-)|eukprot:CAMPEP_0177714846 /NCGR_PEP_ID=MMETSP0484_2-20121128/13668_1 /TAXON_ID=354590 /ORGANISM="Rhodomonas lens, Strain RHODO" /LENGTH=322 /DNA_ID=CAMNT_0019226785 /DNA_START=87 /DNA_END=1055 /DNA_ORIENTATION=+